MDYCTLWFEGWWSDCCKAHDNDYALQIGQALADEKLFQCVVSSASSPALGLAAGVIGTVMFLGVRVFGKRFYKRAARSGMG